jgi:hypothetical protein
MIPSQVHAGLPIDTMNKLEFDGSEDSTTMLSTELTTETLVEMSWYSDDALRERCQDVLMVSACVVENVCVSGCQRLLLGLVGSFRLPGGTLKIHLISTENRQAKIRPPRQNPGGRAA